MTPHEMDSHCILHTYRRFPVEIVRGEGMYLFDRQGKAYLDFLGGIAVNALGYAHPGLLAAITQQAARYIHVSNYFVQKPQVELAEQLCTLTGYSKVFFCNSGTEASEGALKLARKWGNTQGRTELITMTNSFHGRTMGSLSMMNSEEYRQGFGPFLEGCIQIPFNDVDALTGAVNERTVGVFLECIQGEGGVVEVHPEFAQRLNTLRAQHNILLLADEVQSGLGRTGKFFGFEHFGLKPDVVTLAKPLGGGLPLGAILVTAALSDVLQPGMHGTTFGGNPVACAAGKVVLREITAGGLMERAAVTGAHLQARLKALQARFPDKIREVRGKGLMVGCELSLPGKVLVETLLQRGMLINCTHQTVLRFLPPLIAEPIHVDALCEALSVALEALP